MIANAIGLATTIQTSPSVRVFVFEATQLACELLSRALEQSQYGLTVVGMGVSLKDKAAFQLVESDVALISAKLADGPLAGFTLLRSLARTDRSAQFVMLLDQADRALVVEAFRRGAAGVHERNQPCEMLFKCVHRINSGQVWANSQQMRYLVEALSSGMVGSVTDVKGQHLLTTREDEIVSLVARGLKNREIATLLKVSEHTVKNHLFRIFEKLGISSRTELLLYSLGSTERSRIEEQSMLIA